MASSTPHPVDRRVRRSRRALRDALIALVLEHGYDAVTVEAIVQRADVARATFYAHYTDKADVLAEVMEDLTTELTERLPAVAATGPDVRGQAMRELFRHAADRREIYRVALSGAANGRARETYRDAIEQAMLTIVANAVAANNATPRLPLQLIARTWAGAHLALLDWWLNDQPELPLDDITFVGVQLLANGYFWSAGLDSFTFDPSDLQPTRPLV